MTAFGIGAIAAIAGYATGGAAYAAAGGTAAVGSGGALLGMGSGAVGFIGSSSVSTVGNGLLLGDPVPSLGDQIKGLGISVATAGIVNGTSAAIDGRNFWTGAEKALGRGTFSFNNTPKIQEPPKVQPLGKQLLDASKQKTPTFNISRDNITEYTLNYEAAGITRYAPDGIKIDVSIPRPKIKGYHPSLSLKTNLYHNFPTTFDKTIIQSGSIAQRISDGAFMYTIPGHVNGVQGIYTIGINSNGIIFHRTFYNSVSFLKYF